MKCDVIELDFALYAALAEAGARSITIALLARGRDCDDEDRYRLR